VLLSITKSCRSNFKVSFGGHVFKLIFRQKFRGAKHLPEGQFFKMCFHKKPSFYQTGGWGPGCEIDSVDLISGLFKKLK
jgi:hypothetical protein